MGIITHRGPWDDESRRSGALKFMEKYVKAVDSLERGKWKSDAWYADMAVHFDTKGQAHIGGSHIWNYISRQLYPFRSTHNAVVEIRVIPDDLNPGQQIVYAQFLTHFLLKGDLDEEEILVPRMMVYTLKEAKSEGTEGLQIQEVRQFWDTGIIGRYVTEKKKREARKRRFEDDGAEGGECRG